MSYNNIVMDKVYDHKKWKKRVLWKLLGQKKFRKRFFHSDFFYREVLNTSPIPRRALDELAQPSKVSFENFFSRNGNLSPYELMVIVSLIVNRKPKQILEIGTFDGNTTLQMALNAPKDAIIHTIDLPPGETSRGTILKSDLKFIGDISKHAKKFQNKPFQAKIQQHFGDSTNYPFSSFTKEGLLDFIFIDGGHSYDCVKSDTENALKVLNQKGCILWHDFTPHFEGVFRYLCELHSMHSLVHIEGTNLVIYEA